MIVAIDPAHRLRARFRSLWTSLDAQMPARARLKVVPTHKPDESRLAANLNRLLIDKGMRQSDLARLVFGSTEDPQTGYSRAKGADSVSAYCSGRQTPRKAILGRMAKALGVSEDQLTGDPAQQGIRYTPTGTKHGRLTFDMDVTAAQYAKIARVLAEG